MMDVRAHRAKPAPPPVSLGRVTGEGEGGQPWVHGTNKGAPPVPPTPPCCVRVEGILGRGAKRVPGGRHQGARSVASTRIRDKRKRDADLRSPWRVHNTACTSERTRCGNLLTSKFQC